MYRVKSVLVIWGALASFMAATVASSAQAQVASDKLDPQRFEQKLQTTRDVIEKERAAQAIGGAKTITPMQNVIDICRKNPKLPQCALQ